MTMAWIPLERADCSRPGLGFTSTSTMHADCTPVVRRMACGARSEERGKGVASLASLAWQAGSMVSSLGRVEDSRDYYALVDSARARTSVWRGLGGLSLVAGQRGFGRVWTVERVPRGWKMKLELEFPKSIPRRILGPTSRTEGCSIYLSTRLHIHSIHSIYLSTRLHIHSIHSINTRNPRGAPPVSAVHTPSIPCQILVGSSSDPRASEGQRVAPREWNGVGSDISPRRSAACPTLAHLFGLTSAPLECFE
ncbi:hypothetical protein BZA05DRAFT_200423 [Tricharina praecox]|uniref:uncharacterized protein n=1 Tax=Tricharina praecox TaxID=43433 RepID=UPI00221EBDA8|nr:uncharacterized protein BZA05DRAFT_200423 [Tricharina praecox]KAI5856417.1 hypothetical protein BZA05DRAFT_200423 [Tricharina praecox]